LDLLEPDNNISVRNIADAWADKNKINREVNWALGVMTTDDANLHEYLCMYFNIEYVNFNLNVENIGNEYYAEIVKTVDNNNPIFISYELNRAHMATLVGYATNGKEIILVNTETMKFGILEYKYLHSSFYIIKSVNLEFPAIRR